jgi:hypothetical protein
VFLAQLKQDHVLYTSFILVAAESRPVESAQLLQTLVDRAKVGLFVNYLRRVHLVINIFLIDDQTGLKKEIVLETDQGKAKSFCLQIRCR